MMVYDNKFRRYLMGTMMILQFSNNWQVIILIYRAHPHRGRF